MGGQVAGRGYIHIYIYVYVCICTYIYMYMYVYISGFCCTAETNTIL